MDFTETFHVEDTITLTLEERREADQLQRDEKLRRADPAAYDLQLRKRRIEQQREIDAQLSSIRAQNVQNPLAPAQDPHEAFLNFQIGRISTDHTNALPCSTSDLMTGIETTPLAPTRDPDPMTGVETTPSAPTRDPVSKSPLSTYLEAADLPPVQASNTRIQFRASQSPEQEGRATNLTPRAPKPTTSPPWSPETLKAFAPYPILQNMLEREAQKRAKKDSS